MACDLGAAGRYPRKIGPRGRWLGLSANRASWSRAVHRDPLCPSGSGPSGLGWLEVDFANISATNSATPSPLSLIRDENQFLAHFRQGLLRFRSSSLDSLPGDAHFRRGRAG